MSKQAENVKTTVSIPPKLDELFRRQAFNLKLSLGELFIEYQKAYLEKIEREKEAKRLKKEQAEAEKKKD